jgi:NAD-dependent dihydropyrimidine dehydrogenase PreA subunit
MDLNDDEGKSQSISSASSASQDVFNSTISFAWSNARYRGRGYEQTYEQNYIEGLSFNSAERGQFNFSAMGGLNDASRYKEVVEGIEANNFTFGSIGQATNYLQSATNYAQGWKVALAGTNRNYKGAARATYSSGLMENGWAFAAQLAWRYTPYIDVKGQIGEGIAYSSVGYFLTAEKQWGKDKRLSLITFGAPTRRGQSSALTQETYDLTNQYNKTTWGHNNYNPYWGYQDGKVRNSRIVHSYDPTAIISFDWKIDEENKLKVAAGYHYSMYSNSALTFYNAPDPRPDYYRNLPSALLDGQIDKDGYFISHDLNGKPLGAVTDGGYIKYPLEYNGTPVGHSINLDTYAALTDLWTSRDDNATQINWDAIYAANYANNDPTLGWGMQRVEDQANAAQKNHSDPFSPNYIPNYNVIVATNGAGFNMATGEPAGLLVMNGKEYHGIDGSGFFGILDNGTPIIGTKEEYNALYKDRVQEGIAGFGSRLVKDGKVCIDPNQCNGCGLCINVCPFGAIEKEERA